MSAREEEGEHATFSEEKKTERNDTCSMIFLNFSYETSLGTSSVRSSVRRTVPGLPVLTCAIADVVDFVESESCDERPDRAFGVRLCRSSSLGERVAS